MNKRTLRISRLIISLILHSITPTMNAGNISLETAKKCVQLFVQELVMQQKLAATISTVAEYGQIDSKLVESLILDCFSPEIQLQKQQKIAQYLSKQEQIDYDLQLALSLQTLEQENYFEQITPNNTEHKRIIRKVGKNIFYNDKQSNPQIYLTGLKGLEAKEIYHITSSANTPKNWSCGFHVLANICHMQKKLGLGFISSEQFTKACLKYVNDPSQASTNGDFENIARELKFHNRVSTLGIEENNIVPRFATRDLLIDVELDHIPSKFEKEQFLALGQIQRENALWHELESLLNQGGNQAIYFWSKIISMGEPHAILIAVVKTAAGARSAYIFDNINSFEPDDAQIQIRTYAKFIHYKFLN